MNVQEKLELFDAALIAWMSGEKDDSERTERDVAGRELGTESEWHPADQVV